MTTKVIREKRKRAGLALGCIILLLVLTLPTIFCWVLPASIALFANSEPNATGTAYWSNNDSLPVWSPDSTRIAFTSTRNVNTDLYVMAIDGSSLEQLTSDDHAEGDVQWTVDGRQLVFTSNELIWIINADESGLRQLVDRDLQSAPVLSPDGRQVAFISATEDLINDIYVIGLDGTGLIQITDARARLGQGQPPFEFESVGWSADSAFLAFRVYGYGSSHSQILTVRLSDLASGFISDAGHSPLWSPVNAELIYATFASGDNTFDVYITNPTGSEVRPVAHIDGSGLNRVEEISQEEFVGVEPFSIDWAADGSKLAYTTEHELINSIEIVNADGSGLRSLTDRVQFTYRPTWSPNGEWIAFYSDSESFKTSTWAMKLDGSELVELSNELWRGDIAWSPNGRYLAFTSFRDGDNDIYLFDTTTSEVSQLTN